MADEPLFICDRYDWCDLRRGHTGPCLDDYGQDLASGATGEEDDQQDDQDQEQHATQTDVHDTGLPTGSSNDPVVITLSPTELRVLRTAVEIALARYFLNDEGDPHVIDYFDVLVEVGNKLGMNL